MTDFSTIDFSALQKALDDTGRCNAWNAWNEWKSFGATPLDMASIFERFNVDENDIDRVFTILAELYSQRTHDRLPGTE